jgi:hypothetical protein
MIKIDDSALHKKGFERGKRKKAGSLLTQIRANKYIERMS